MILYFSSFHSFIWFCLHISHYWAIFKLFLFVSIYSLFFFPSHSLIYNFFFSFPPRSCLVLGQEQTCKPVKSNIGCRNQPTAMSSSTRLKKKIGETSLFNKWSRKSEFPCVQEGNWKLEPHFALGLIQNQLEAWIKVGNFETVRGEHG